jgi:signal transduction histidine kinase
VADDTSDVTADLVAEAEDRGTAASSFLTRFLTRRRAITAGVIAMSVGITAAMSLLFHGRVRGDMAITGLFCAIIIDRVVNRITRHYRRRLAEAHALLERRVAERTAALQTANQSLREAARHQESLTQELMTRDRMATAGLLAAGVSHEIRSPLSVILIVAEALVEDLPADAPHETRQMLGDVIDASTRISCILKDLSSIARPVEDPIVATDLRAAIDSAVRLASYRLAPNATLEVAPFAVPPVRGNAARLVQLVLNLVGNAARATRPDAPNAIQIDARADGDDVVVWVTDTGTGMSPETHARLFTPFFTTGGDRGGTGLGLSICRSLLERMGGSIEVRTELGAGTTVEVRLQRAA